MVGLLYLGRLQESGYCFLSFLTNMFVCQLFLNYVLDSVLGANYVTEN